MSFDPSRHGLVPFVLFLATAFPQWTAASEARGGGGGPPPAPVTVAKVERRTFLTRLQVFGESEAIRESRPSAETDGLVSEVLVDAGDRLTDAQPLVRLDVVVRQIDRRRAASELELAQEQLREYRAGSRPEEIRQAEEAKNAASVRTEETKRDLERIRSLWKESTVSEQEFTAAKAAAMAAEHLLQEKTALWEMVKKGPRAEILVRAEAQVAMSQAALDSIDEDIRRATILAPFPGVVTAKLVERGDYVRKGDPVASIVQIDPIRVTLAVPETAVVALREGDSIAITLDAFPGAEFEGTVRAVVPLGDPLARTFPVKVDLANPEGRILPGMTARATVTRRAERPSLSVPADALVRIETAQLVYVVREGFAVAVPVVPGVVEGGLLEVRGALEEGERVVIRGNERLSSGTPVSPEEGTPPPAGDEPEVERP